MKCSPRVSIILPTYNRAELLPNAIRSVLSQDFPDWELIVWDDGSNDNTRDVVLSFSDDRIVYNFALNAGMSYALNQAVKKARGEFIAFLDDDDQWTDEKLFEQIKILEKYDEIGLVFGDFKNINLATGDEGFGFEQSYLAMNGLVTEPISGDSCLIKGNFLKCLGKDNFIAFDSVMIRKEVLDSLGEFNQDLRNGQDFEMWWRFGLVGNKPAFTKKCVLTRIKYPNSLSGRSLLSIDNYLKALDSCCQLASNHGQYEAIKFLKPAYRNAWQNKIILHGKQGEKKKAWNAFLQSLRYGFRLGSFKLLVKALME